MKGTISAPIKSAKCISGKIPDGSASFDIHIGTPRINPGSYMPYLLMIRGTLYTFGMSWTEDNNIAGMPSGLVLTHAARSEILTVTKSSGMFDLYSGYMLIYAG